MKETIVAVYKEAETETEQQETIKELAKEFQIPKFEVRQILQEAKVYNKKDKTEKEVYANALYCVTQVPEKEFMKMSLKAMKQLMDVFRGKV